MKHIILIFLISSGIQLFAQDVNLNFVMVAEVASHECDGHESVFFVSSVLNKELEKLTHRQDFLESTREDYKLYVKDLVDIEFPQYYLKDCIPEVEKWYFYEEWTIENAEHLKDFVTTKFSSVRTVDTDFILKVEPEPVVVEKEVKEIDPNKAIVDAFYSQALAEYESKNYDKTISILNKANALLGEKVNLEVILLEAKTREITDRNISKTKELYRKFLTKAAKQRDSRVNEIANQLVKIETSDQYHNSGFKKFFDVETTLNGNKVTNREFLNDLGEVTKNLYIDKNNENSKLKEIDYTSPAGKKITYFDSREEAIRVEYYKGNQLHLMINNDEKSIIYYFNDKGTQKVTYKDNAIDLISFKNFETIKYNTKNLEIENAKILETYPVDLKELNSTNFTSKMGIVKSLKVELEKEQFEIYTFNQDGTPMQKVYFKKEGKPKAEFKFNKTTLGWDEI